MKLYNTLTRKLESFCPIEPGLVKFYSCGPTVYSYYHIGNLRNAVFNDTLRRSLEFYGYNVKHIMNITDVGHLTSDADEGEDKLEKGAKQSGKTVWEVADYYTKAFKDDMKNLNVQPPNGYNGKTDSYARATDFIDSQIEIIELLMAKGFAYQTNQAIYFSVDKLASYGKLSGQKLTDKETAARSEVVTDLGKKNPRDFAVWFFMTGHFADHSMHWTSPWGEGFPGWHLECSAIIHATLGEPIDIHTGGVDHIGTHHPNEMAQSEAAFGVPLANYWLHNEFVLVDGQKMSKSLGNTYTLSDITEKGFKPAALRLLYLQAHYRSQLNFSWEGLAAARSRLRSYQAIADLRYQFNPDALLLGDDFFSQLATELGSIVSIDLATPAVLTKIDETFARIEKAKGVHPVHSKDFKDMLSNIEKLLGLGLLDSPDITSKQKTLINKRNTARASGNWSEADEIRKQLLEVGIELDDLPNTTNWKRAV